ncbi:hypothetical protein PAXINDRAFT_11935 [Paxillus involutus ATCC 200175]|uniref:Carboxylesterase type B domain-containing protein n=1 Tax=Paxillus involutus ATCC 200175 TaxID=664439 RepID=A0A0C9U8I6_PAXIN|nr:hypothetical protein PAXINDRAFT_11935 [Paxillus involutus ATCC 200175]
MLELGMASEILERLALYWVQKCICAFGGDSTKVTIIAREGRLCGHTLYRSAIQNADVNQHGLFTVSKRLKTLPYLGATHGSDVSNVYGAQDMTSYLVRFVSNLDPNGGTDLYWPQQRTFFA